MKGLMGHRRLREYQVLRVVPQATQAQPEQPEQPARRVTKATREAKGMTEKQVQRVSQEDWAAGPTFPPWTILRMRTEPLRLPALKGRKRLESQGGRS